jgi:hypothetical protein
MLVDASMVEPEQEAVCVAGIMDAQLNPSDSWELEDIVFCEFLEALARVAVQVIEKYKDSNFTDGKRVRLAFNFVSELQDVGSGATASASGTGSAAYGTSSSNAAARTYK